MTLYSCDLIFEASSNLVTTPCLESPAHVVTLRFKSTAKAQRQYASLPGQSTPPEISKYLNFSECSFTETTHTSVETVPSVMSQRGADSSKDASTAEKNRKKEKTQPVSKQEATRQRCGRRP